MSQSSRTGEWLKQVSMVQSSATGDNHTKTSWVRAPLRESTTSSLHFTVHTSYSTICRIILVFWLSKSLVSGSTAIRIVIHSAEVVHFTHTPCTLKRLACQGIQRGCNDKDFTLHPNCHNPGGGSGHRGRWLYPPGGTPMGEYGLSVQAHLVGLKQEVHLAANS